MPDNRRCGWTRRIYNYNEPANSIIFEGFLGDDGVCHADFLSFAGTFRDGRMHACILPSEDRFFWEVDSQNGYADSFLDAYQKLPAFLTHPDDYDEGNDWVDNP